jgi:hypothetical protein
VNTVALAMLCKTPCAGGSKTRLSPPLSPQECAALSACFIRDVAATADSLPDAAGIVPYAVCTPAGSEAELRALLPGRFQLLPQREGDLGARMAAAISDLLALGHAGVVLIGADSPTLPASILRDAAEAVRHGDRAVIAPALDGGYLLIGLSRPYPGLFHGVSWSTSTVYAATLERARALGLPVTSLPGWYDVDDEASLRLLEAELRGVPPPCAAAGVTWSDAPATRRFLASLRAAAASGA